MAAAPLIIAGAGMAISAIGKWKAGKAAKKEGEAQQRAAESQAALLDYNANVADLQAKDAVARGTQEEGQLRQRIRSTIGAQRASFAATGVDTGYGSAADTQADAAMLGELDTMTVRQNAAREAWGYKVEAIDLRRKAEITRKEGVNMAEAGKRAQSAARWGVAADVAIGTGNLLAAKYGWGDKKAS